MPTATTHSLVTQTDDGRINVAPSARDDVQQAVLAFLDMAGTATGRATAYNTKEEQVAAMDVCHEAVFSSNRGLYAAIACLPGMTDISRQMAVSRLVGNGAGVNESLLTPEEETQVVSYLMREQKITQKLRQFGDFRKNRINNKRIKRLVLNTLIGSPDLPYWAIKYRAKMRQALCHAWGIGRSSWIRETLGIPGNRRTAKQRDDLAKQVDAFIGSNRMDRKEVYQCVGFILGTKGVNYTVSTLKNYEATKGDFSKGSSLPTEILEGMRSVFHPERSHADVIELTKATMTEGEKMKVQRTAKKSGVEVDFDPMAQDIVKLYIYAMEMGGTQEIRESIDKKALDIARTYPVSYEKTGIVVDTSGSMFGSETQKKRPMAIAMAMRDVLAATSKEPAIVTTTGGTFDQFGFAQPEGDTSLAEALVELLSEKVDVVYMITDGYENAPAGRVNEVIVRAREIGIETPIYQVTPVAAAEAVGKDGGVRRLSSDVIPLPVSRPAAIGLPMVRAALTGDIEQGIRALLETTRPLLGTRA